MMMHTRAYLVTHAAVCLSFSLQCSHPVDRSDVEGPSADSDPGNKVTPFENFNFVPERIEEGSPPSSPSVARPHASSSNNLPQAGSSDTTPRGSGFRTAPNVPVGSERNPYPPSIPKEELCFEDRLFNGNYSDVHRAKWKEQTVAIKVIRSLKLSAEAMDRKRKREIDTWWELCHPNILPLLGFVEDIEPIGPLGAMVSPYYQNGNASDYLAKAALPFKEKLTLWLQVIEGMSYLHGYYPIIVHGDLKPQNILIDDNLCARICDFGLVRLILERGNTGLTTTTAHTGTDRYKSRELIKNRRAKPTVTSDIHALGCIGLEFVLSTIPYAAYNSPQKIEKASRANEPPAKRPKKLSGEIGFFWDQLQACWDIDPSERPTTISLFHYVSRYLIPLAEELEREQGDH